jgi:parvulin-like peptidyl-prolyl isomerase
MLAKQAQPIGGHARKSVGVSAFLLWKAAGLFVLLLWGVAAARSSSAAPADASPDAYFGPAPVPSSYPGMPASYVPGAPAAPQQTTRPSGWPGATPADGPTSPTTANPAGMPPGGQRPAGYSGPGGSLPGTSLAPYQPPQPGEARLDGIAPVTAPAANAPAMQLCASSQIFARVGSDVILAADVMPRVNELILARLKEVTPEQLKQIPPEQFDSLRVAWAKKLLEEYVKIKLVYLDARREIPKEAMTNVEKKLNDLFDKEEVPKIMTRLKVTSRPEMESKLRANGTNMERERQAFIEMFLAKQWQQDKVKISEEISHEETIRYFRDHAKEFEHAAQARWEELMTRTSNYPSKAAAIDALAQMGNAVINGAAFAEVAKSRSDGPTASKGGSHDWTNQGSLVSEEMDRALFGLRIGAMSQIIEDKVGFHIVRVVERKELYRTPFTEAQVLIRSKIKEERTRRETTVYIEKLREQTPIWIASDLSVGLIPMPMPSGGEGNKEIATRPGDKETQR